MVFFWFRVWPCDLLCMYVNADAQPSGNGPKFMSICPVVGFFKLIYEPLLMQDMSLIKFDDGRAGSGHYCIALDEDAATKARIIE